MLPAIFAGSSIPVLEQVTSFTESRHSVLAGNLANIDTPGYRSRDLSTEGFEARLRSAIAARDSHGSVDSSGTITSFGALTSLPGVGLASTMASPASMQHVNDNLNDLLHHDDSNVSLEKQVSEITKNQLRHNMALTIMTAQFRLLESAINERA